MPEGKTSQRNGLSGNRRVLARTRSRLATGNGNGHRRVTGNGNVDRPTIAKPVGKVAGPNGLKLSDRGWR